MGMSLFSGLWQGMQSFFWLAFAPQAWGVVRLLLGAALMLAGFRTATAPGVGRHGDRPCCGAGA